jgi:hypothetical protein
MQQWQYTVIQDAVCLASWEAFLADVPMSWVQA